VIDLARTGRITSEVTPFDLDDAPAAYDALRAGTLRGRAVVQPSV
jgi:propanol-preferring alcohol dehydrogenase